jgi:hypothetical protein
MSLSLSALHNRLAWPTEDDLIDPKGTGPRILAEAARAKIERALRRELNDEAAVRIGLLTKNPASTNTEAPIAVVCEFSRQVSDSALALAHRLAWNFARSPLLITVEPHQVRTWTCCEPPDDESLTLFEFELQAEIKEAKLDLTVSLSPSERAAHALHWVRLATGDFYRRFPDRFRRDGRADRVLLKELTAVRLRLQKQGLTGREDTIHDLLARIVFAQFLFDRKDADGTAALNPSLLSTLRDEGHLSGEHTELGTILADRDEAYRFFRWLNEKFNGDLFPGKGTTQKQREAEWQAEMSLVEPRHLKTLADFVSGQMLGRQRVFWRLYRFDVIPLEFISSVYEEFVVSTGAHYTPGFLVDFMLDEVLPWDGDNWKVKILDPACGSGIFLVKAYQRLIQRWKNANPGRKLSAVVLRRLLERYLYGCDIDPQAVRVASFSLYLTMCDEIDPKNYLRNTQFPRLRDERLIHADFFREDKPGLSTANDGPTYDLIVGNAPWGQSTETEFARKWAHTRTRNWPIANKAVGTLFLAKAASLTKPTGRVSMIQPASSLLFNRSGPANRFREKLFSEFKVEEVVNLSTLRFELFENATSPPCIVTMRSSAPDGESLLYISPKQAKPAGGADVAESSYSVVIEPHDISQVLPDEAVFEPNVWTALAWGGRRDLQLIRRLSNLDNIEKWKLRRRVQTCEGVIRGNKSNEDNRLLSRRILFDEDFPTSTFLRLNASQLPENSDACFERPRSRQHTAFNAPQLILKQGWTIVSGRFRAAITIPASDNKGVICSQSYITVHGDLPCLTSAALTYNSLLAVHYLLLTSGRLASYRPEPLVKEMRGVPLVTFADDVLTKVTSLQEADDVVRDAFGFHDAEWALIEDLFHFTLPDFKGDEFSPGRQPTERKPSLKTVAGREPELAAYCQHFIDVLKGGFGEDKHVCATIYQDAPQARLPVRLVAIHLDWDRTESIAIETIDSADLCQRLLELDEKFLRTGDTSRGGVFFQRIARVYIEEQRGRRTIPTIYIVKPDRVRYWTRSAGMRDADEVVADIWAWQAPQPAGNAGRKPK